MQYFSTLPKVVKTGNDGSSILMTNLLARSSVIPSLLNNSALFYQYDIQDGDTPEILAYKYYGESYRYWIILFANQIIDPQWQWPMSSSVFETYLNDKYPSTNVYSTVHSYQKIITSTDVDTGTVTKNVLEIDFDTYSSLIPGTTTYSLPTGNVIVNIDKNAQSVYDYELSLNEKNRTIRILNNQYVSEIENEFQSLMSR
jgi:hypothetical protein